MIDLVRIVEEQASLSSYRATQDEERAVQLELLIELTKPTHPHRDWHPLIATPFRYSPPHSLARFRPLYGRNAFYGSRIEETALYEHAFHFMRERLHLDIDTDVGMRTIFYVEADDENAVNISHEREYEKIMDKYDYSASHQFILDHPHATYIYYPSCRDPKHRDNAAVLSIDHLAQHPKWMSSRKYFYDNKEKQIIWLNNSLRIRWDEVN